jgi:hypothetical protein
VPLAGSVLWNLLSLCLRMGMVTPSLWGWGWRQMRQDSGETRQRVTSMNKERCQLQVWLVLSLEWQSFLHMGITRGGALGRV